MAEIGIFFFYFGSILIPIFYFFGTRFRGRLNRLMLLGLGLQIFWSVAVYGFVYYNWSHGYSEYYWGWALLVPVNIVAALYFLVFIPLRTSQTKPAEQNAAGQPATRIESK